jgi:hypothetical protein
MCLDNDKECGMYKDLKGRILGVVQGTVIFGRAKASDEETGIWWTYVPETSRIQIYRPLSLHQSL